MHPLNHRRVVGGHIILFPCVPLHVVELQTRILLRLVASTCRLHQLVALGTGREVEVRLGCLA